MSEERERERVGWERMDRAHRYLEKHYCQCPVAGSGPMHGGATGNEMR